MQKDFVQNLIKGFLVVMAFYQMGCGSSVSTVSVSLPSTDTTVPETPTTPTVPTVPSTPSTPTLSVISRKIAVGWDKTFAILSGTTKSAGANQDSVNGVNGQLGSGATGNTNQSTLTALNDTGTSYLSVASGEILSCGITGAQRIKCWGTPTGDGTSNTRYSPVLINDTTLYVALAVGSYHACGITSDGVAKCWGDGWDGKLGNADASGATQDSPVIADSGTKYKRIAAGRNHTCGLTENNKIRCWGTNDNGQIGIGSLVTPQLTPQTIDSATDYAEVFAGEDSTCGITSTGVLKCWGLNNVGQLGDNSTTRRTSPTVIDTGVSYSQVSIGGTYFYHTCGITTTGVLKCWGDNSQGQLGRGNTTASLVPVVIDTGVSYREVSAFGKHSCGITTGGTLKCWGNNSAGQLGTGNTTQQTSPATIGTGY